MWIAFKGLSLAKPMFLFIGIFTQFYSPTNSVFSLRMWYQNLHSKEDRSTGKGQSFKGSNVSCLIPPLLQKRRIECRKGNITMTSWRVHHANLLNLFALELYDFCCKVKCFLFSTNIINSPITSYMPVKKVFKCIITQVLLPQWIHFCLYQEFQKPFWHHRGSCQTSQPSGKRFCNWMNLQLKEKQESRNMFTVFLLLKIQLTKLKNVAIAKIRPI